MAMGLTLGGKKPGGAQPVMNVTPLVDVVLVLLIIFMVVAPLLSKNFWLEVPKVEKKNDAPAAADNRNIVVTIDVHGAVRINSLVVGKDDLQRRLSQLLAERTEKTVYFNAANDAPYADVVDVLDRARGGGAATIAVVSTELELPK
jgi:biopolymer transport protein ExbD/biopolymer transport protein TolR